MGMGDRPKSGRDSSGASPMRLHTAGSARGFRKPIVARITTEPIPACERKDAALVLPSLDDAQTIFMDMQPSLSNRKSMADGFPRPLCIRFETSTTSSRDTLLCSNQQTALSAPCTALNLATTHYLLRSGATATA